MRPLRPLHASTSSVPVEATGTAPRQVTGMAAAVGGRLARHRRPSEPSYLRSSRALEGRAGFFMALPAQLLFVVFFLMPFGYAIYIALTSPATGRYVGLRNFRFAVESTTFWSSVTRVAYFGVIQVTAMVVIGLVLAFLIDSPLCAGKKVFRLVYFAPYAVPGVLAAIMWGFLFSPTLDSILSVPKDVGLASAAINPLTPRFVIYAIMLIVTWEFTGYNMTLYLTSLSSIPKATLDAAVVDGCGQLRLVRHVKLPLIRRMLMFTLILSIIGTLQLFNEPAILSTMTSMSPNYTPNMAIYDQAFTIGNIPLASAMSLVLGAITVGASLIFYYLWRRTGRSVAPSRAR
jgi:multiple sugar transport system permease protein